MQTIRLDITPNTIPAIVNVSQGDVGRVIAFVLYDGSEEFSIPTGATVTIMGTKSDGHPFSYDEQPYDGSIVTVTTTQQMTAAAGKADCEIRVKTTELGIYTANFILDVEKMALPTNEELSEMDMPVIIKAAEAGEKIDSLSDKLDEAEELIAEIEGNVTKADASATNAAQSASAAETAATEAKTSEANALASAEAATASATTATNAQQSASEYATEASDHANEAEESATNAARSETNASDSAKLSESWAVGGTSTRFGEDTNNSKYYAEQAAKSAAEASGSITGVATWNGRAGSVKPQTGDYTASQVSTANGSDVETELNGKATQNDLTELSNKISEVEANIPTEYVKSFNNRNGEVKPISGDYTATLITTSSGNTVQDEINKHASKSITVITSGWSSTTVTVDGRAYYTYSITGLTVYDDKPDVSVGASGTLPTSAEQTAFECIRYAITNQSSGTLVLYAETLPESDFVVDIKGVA